MMALIDITVRHIADLSPGDKVPGGGCNGDGSCVETETKWGDMTLNGDEGQGHCWSQVSVGGCSETMTGVPRVKGARHEVIWGWAVCRKLKWREW